MKKMLVWVFVLSLASALCLGAFAEGLVTEVEDIASEAVELNVLKAEEVLPTGNDFEATLEYADFVGEAAVSAFSGVAIDEINFPDKAFREYVKENFDIDGDGVLSEDERIAVDEINVGGEGITSLKGIEWFPNLEMLNCTDNQLTSLDVCANTELTVIKCSDNQLKRLDIGENGVLDCIKCESNQLKTIDVSKCPALRELYCSNNQLSSLDISKNTKMDWLECFSNQITVLDVSNCKSLISVMKTKLYQRSDFVYCDCEDGALYFDPSTSVIANGKALYGTAPEKVSLATAKLTVKAQTWTSKALKPAVTVSLDGVTLKSGTDYTVSYKNNKSIGTATATITGIGSYTGTATANFKINPKAVSGLKLQVSKKQLTASWKKVAGVTGYQIQYGLKSNFKGAKLLTVKKDKTVKKVLKRLKLGKVYYVRIRAYKKVGKATYYSAWSQAIKKKVK